MLKDIVQDNMEAKFYIVFLSCLLLYCSSCKTQQRSEVAEVASAASIFLDSIAASVAINQDKTQGFFEKISLIDIGIQLKSKERFASRKAGIQAYKEFLASEVLSFNEDEKTFMLQVMSQIKRQIDSINPNLWMNDIRLIKTRTNHYGPNVYYTRDKNIIIPENVLKSKSMEEHNAVMLHEFFHILSRYNPQLREDLYALIGFHRHNRDLQINSRLADISLINPDGISTDYSITLYSNAREIEAIPIITSVHKSYKENIPAFFSYLKFDLYEIDDDDQILFKTDGAGTITDGMNSFFQQIGDNTQYIIHPDEILADNFMLGVLSTDSGDFSRYSEKGKKLIDDILEVLKSGL